MNFLKDNSHVDFDEAEVRHLVNYELLNKDVWNSMIVVSEDNNLREQVLARKTASWKDISKLPYVIEE